MAHQTDYYDSPGNADNQLTEEQRKNPVATTQMEDILHCSHAIDATILSNGIRILNNNNF